jgi:hypothetical protein
MARDDSDPIAEIIGDYRAFAAMQRDRLVARGHRYRPVPPESSRRPRRRWDLYVHQRRCSNVTRGRTSWTSETGIPPVHRRVYRTGLEHLGVVVGDEFNDFDGFRHVDDWVPQQLVTATGPDPLPRLTRRS